jgi:hypothetical protein
MTQFKIFALALGAMLAAMGSVAMATPIASIPSVGLSPTAVHTEGMERREARRGERRIAMSVALSAMSTAISAGRYGMDITDTLSSPARKARPAVPGGFSFVGVSGLYTHPHRS